MLVGVHAVYIYTYTTYQHGQQAMLVSLFEDEKNELRKRIKNNIVWVAVEKFAFLSLLDKNDENYTEFGELWDDMMSLIFKSENGMSDKFKSVLQTDKRDRKFQLNKFKSKFFAKLDQEAAEDKYRLKWDREYDGYATFLSTCNLMQSNHI